MILKLKTNFNVQSRNRRNEWMNEWMDERYLNYIGCVKCFVIILTFNTCVHLGRKWCCCLIKAQAHQEPSDGWHIFVLHGISFSFICFCSDFGWFCVWFFFCFVHFEWSLDFMWPRLTISITIYFKWLLDRLFIIIIHIYHSYFTFYILNDSHDA